MVGLAEHDLESLREIAVNEALPLVDRIRAEVERMRLVDEILEERLHQEELARGKADR